MAPNATNSSGKPENGSRNGSQSVRPGLPFLQSAGCPSFVGVCLRPHWETAHVIGVLPRGGEIQSDHRLQRFFVQTQTATNFRSFVFSSRNCFASCAWLTSIPPYFAFQA